jgi:radical SAM superfamily enzyme YgiQ (UPF0313 family)
LRDYYRDEGKFVRRRSVGNVIEELKRIQHDHYVGYFSFEDDTFLENRKYSIEFLTAYKKHVGAPYICETRFDTLTEENVILLKASGCFLVSLGIESGSERIREAVLHKCLKTEKIIDGARLLKKHKIRFRSYNIIGNPGETLEDALNTLAINKEIKTDYPQVSLFQPYPGTPLTNQLINQGDWEENYYEIPASLWSRSIMKQANMEELESLQKLFYVLVKIPLLHRYARSLVKISLLRPFYEFIYKVTYLYYTALVYRLGFLRVISFGFRMRKLC